MSPYLLAQFTPQETKVLLWSLRRTLAGLDASLTLPVLKARGFSLHRASIDVPLSELLLGVPPRCSGKSIPRRPLRDRFLLYRARLCLCSGRTDPTRIKAALEGRGLYPRFLVIPDLARLARAKVQLEELTEYLSSIQTSYDKHPPAQVSRRGV